MTLDELVDEIVRYSDGYYGAKMGPVARANIKTLIAEHTTMKEEPRCHYKTSSGAIHAVDDSCTHHNL